MSTANTTKRLADSLTLDKGSSHQLNPPHQESGLWLWVAIGEAIIICGLIALLLRKRSRSEQDKTIAEAKRGEVDYGNVIASSFLAKSMYDKLKKVCHPDRFPVSQQPEKHQIATELSAEIAKHKHDIKELKRLASEVEHQLGIKINL